MNKIEILDQKTVDQIAAGEVVERPASVVKELAENAIDAGARAVTIEIKDGGITMIRITDDGCGIARDEIPMAFLRHATSKIRNLKDLDSVSSFGFRGEALSSIASVSRVELITKRAEDMTASHIFIDGGRAAKEEEIGAPDGTTIFVRDLFYNTPARAKFLKTAMTEASHVGAIAEQLALSNPFVSVKYVANGALRIDTTGNGSLKDVIYQIYGRKAASCLVPVETSDDGCGVSVAGYIAKPEISRGNRGFENYYVNGRYIHSRILEKAVEDGFGNRLMMHQYPFTCLLLTVDGTKVDVNVHPSKMEVRFSSDQAIYETVKKAVDDTLSKQEMIIQTGFAKIKKDEPEHEKIKAAIAPEPFEKKFKDKLREEGNYNPGTDLNMSQRISSEAEDKTLSTGNDTELSSGSSRMSPDYKGSGSTGPSGYEQETLPEGFLSQASAGDRRIIGQVFKTYWLVEFKGSLFIIDQHAAHEKVLYERLIKAYQKRKLTSQNISPPIIVTLDSREENLLHTHMEAFTNLGFEIDNFGGHEISISAVPYTLSNLGSCELFRELLDHLEDTDKVDDLDLYTHRVATEACKAAVKGNGCLSFAEAERLIDELMTLDDPYHCPHGRPTIIAFSRSDLEKKFKRIV